MCGKDESTPVERPQKSTPRSVPTTPCHHMSPTTRLVPSACVHSACARDAQGVLSLRVSPQCAQFVRKFQASACIVAQRTQAHERACRAHSLGPRNRLPSSMNPHTGGLAWTAAFSQASALAAAFFTHAATKCESDFFLCTISLLYNAHGA